MGETEAACEGLVRAARQSRAGGDFDSTVALFERARELAGDAVSPAARAEEAELLVELGRKDAALAVLRPGELGDAPLEDGELGRARGRVLARAGDYEGAAALLSKAGDERSDEDRLWLAWSLTMRGRYDEASALVAEPPGGDARLRARYGRVAGTIAWHRGRPDQAKLLLLDAREAAERCGDVRVRVEVEQSLATAEHLLGELANAARRYEGAATLCREAGLVVHLAKILNNLAIVRYLAGEWDQAHDAWQSMHELAERLGSREEVLLAHNNLGLLYSNRGELHRAEHSFGRALALAIAAGVPRYEAMVLGNRAEARTRAGDLVRASEDLARSRELSREVGATAELRECRRRGAALALARGETEWALEEARSAATEAADAGDALEAGSTWLLASAAARHLGRLDEAQECLRISSDAIGAAGTRLEQALLRLEEARVLSAQGRHELAKSAARQAAAAFAELGAERELKEAREIEWGAQGTGRADAMFELLDAAASAPDAPALLQGVLERLVRISRAERGFVITLSSEHGPRVAARFAVAGDDGPPRLSRGIADRVMASRRALVIADIEDELDLASRQSVMSLGLRAALCAPLMQGETCLGLLYLDSQHGTELARLGTWALEGAAAVLAPALDRMVERERELERRALLQATAEEAIETLAGVDAALDMLDDTLDPESHRSLVARARQRCAQLVGRSDGLLTLLRVERDMVSCVGEPVELRALLGAAVDVFGAEGGRIEVQIDESSGAVRADLDHLSPAIVRVVELVSEAAGSGGVVTVCARPAEVAAPSGELHEWRPGSTVGANFVWIEVQASCVAAPEELGGDHLHRIDRDGSTSALALRVVQRVVTALGGRLWLDQSRERVRVVMELEAAA